jgi:hypothetical protein
MSRGSKSHIGSALPHAHKESGLAQWRESHNHSVAIIFAALASPFIKSLGILPIHPDPKTRPMAVHGAVSALAIANILV